MYSRFAFDATGFSPVSAGNRGNFDGTLSSHDEAVMIERFARLGYASIGVVYIIIGALAAFAGLGRGGSTGGHEDAFSLILRQPFGRTMLVVIALGLTGYTLWRLISAVADTDSRGSDAKGIGVRIGSFVRGILYAAVTIEVVRMLMHRGEGGEGSDARAKHWTARVMEEPFGGWLVAAAGLGIVGYGTYQLYKAWESKLSKRLHLEGLEPALRRKVEAISRFGIAARGVVFFVIGGSLVVAGVRHNPNAAQGTSGAMQQIAAPLDGWLLVLVGVGLAAYGIYALANARYRSIRT